jgi:hypothetical protein
LVENTGGKNSGAKRKYKYRTKGENQEAEHEVSKGFG